MSRNLFILLVLVAFPVRAQTIAETTRLTLDGRHVTRDEPFTATLALTPREDAQLGLRWAARFADGTREAYQVVATQRAYLIEANFTVSSPGAAGRLAGETADGSGRLVIEHDGAGRFRARSFAGEQLVAEARGAIDQVTTALDVAIVSDLNGYAESTSYGRPVHAAVETLADRLQPDLVLVTGDMVAGQLRGWSSRATELTRTCRAMWRGFHAAVTDPLAAAGIPIAPAPGNHDASVWRPRERELYAEAWRGRLAVEVIDGADFPFRYSFVKNGVFFLALDATRAGHLEHADWAREQLLSPRAQACPVKIAFGHFPLHPTAEQRRTAILHDSLEATFAEAGLTLYAAGHHHAYYPGAAGGVRQVVMACLGGGQRPLLGQSARSPHSVVAIQIRDGELTALEAFTGRDFDQRVSRRSLPGRVGGLTRDDRAGFDSRWEEQAAE